ncbi:AbiV family abortive infection protein [bacterium]|nr:AbiV family abortive infection protein [bacterium]
MESVHREVNDSVIENCTELIETAKTCLREKKYSIASFLAISAIEEAANCLYLMSKMTPEDSLALSKMNLKGIEIYLSEGREAAIEHGKKINEYLNQLRQDGKIEIKALDISKVKETFNLKAHKSHTIKSTFTILSALNINSRARRKLGNYVIKKYLNLAKNDGISKIRTKCLYTTIINDKITIPKNTIREEDAIELISIASEAVAEVSDMGSLLDEQEYVDKTIDRLEALWKAADDYYDEFNIRPKEQVGVLTNYLDKIGVAIVQLTDELHVGDEICIECRESIIYQTVNSMQSNHKSIEKGTEGQDVGIKIDHPLQRNGIVLRIG